VIVSSPDRFEVALAGRNGMKSQADGSWNATAYLWHLTDLARSWAERWIQIRETPGSLPLVAHFRRTLGVEVGGRDVR
jgi:hypothetical protein